MSIQLVGSIGSLWRTIRNDFKTFSQDFTAFQTSQKSGSQDQTSQNALQQAITSLLNDITNVQSSAAGTTTGATNSNNAGHATNPLQTLSQDLTAFQTALNSGDQNQIQSLENTLQNDISALRGHRHHRHHHDAAGETTGTTNGSNAGQATNPLQTLSQDLTAFQTALNSGDQNQIQSLENTLQNDISALQSYSYHRHHRHIANGARYVNANSEQQSTTASSVNLTV